MLKNIKLLFFMSICCAFIFFLSRILISAYSINDLMSQQTELSTEHNRYIIVIAQEYDNPFWRLLEQGVTEEAAKHQIDVDYMGPTRLNQSEQLLLLEEAIHLKPDGIIVQGIHNTAYMQLINEAFEQGIPIITVDSDAKESKRAAYIGSNQLEAGKLLGQYIIDMDSSEHQIGVIVGSLDADNQKERLAGLTAVIENSQYSHIVAVHASDISRLKAADETVQFVKDYPDIDTIVGLSSLDAAGIVDGLSFLNRKDIHVFGFDQLEITKELIKQGHIEATLAQQPEQMGVQAVNTLLNIIQDKSYESIQYIPTTIITK